MQDIEQPKYFQKVEGKQLYKINKNQYLKINKAGNGMIVAPIKDPITKEFNSFNLFFTGGTVWGLIKVILIIALVLFSAWRYQVEVKDCLVIRANFNPETGCISQSYFNSGRFGSFQRNLTNNIDLNIAIPLPNGTSRS